jgi:hypothetical protein
MPGRAGRAPDARRTRAGRRPGRAGRAPRTHRRAEPRGERARVTSAGTAASLPSHRCVTDALSLLYSTLPALPSADSASPACTLHKWPRLARILPLKRSLPSLEAQLNAAVQRYIIIKSITYRKQLR